MYVVCIVVPPNIGQVAPIDHDMVSPTIVIGSNRTIVIHELDFVSCFSLKPQLLTTAAAIVR